MDDGDIRLNEHQRQAVEHTGAPLIVLAGPGSGKTRVIVHRIAHLIEELGVEPESIVALTFTNKAAEEMRRRLAEILGSSARADRVIASTFHSFGLRLIRQFADLAGWRSEPMIVDEGQQRALMRMVIEEAEGESQWDFSRMAYDRYSALPSALQFIGVCRNRAILPEDTEVYATRWAEVFASHSGELDDEERLAEETKIAIFRYRARLYRGFEEACYERGWVTFDDLQTQALRLLREHDEVRAIVRTDHRHLVVDEFQDVNRVQIELLKCLAGPHHDLCVVGDDDQAIYGFRGSIPSGFRQVTEHWPDTQTIELTENYRSTAVIVGAADLIIGKCEDRFKPDKRLIAAGENADLEIALEGVTYEGQSRVGGVIGAMILDYVKRGEAAWGEIAVLVRTNTELGRVAAILQAAGVPIDVPELSDIASHPMVRDILSWMRILADPGDTSHLTRLLIRPPFDIDITTITKWERSYRNMRAEDDRKEFEQAAVSESGKTKSDDNAVSEREAARTFLEYLIMSNPTEEVQSFTQIYQSLQAVSKTESADNLALRIIETTGMLSLDPVNEMEQQVRVEQIGRFLGFVRERMPMLEGAKRVRDFLTYYDDLQASGGSMIPGGTPTDMMDSGVSLSDTNAVRILTAHKSKGLEFDIVFIPQVNSPSGYPNKPKGRSVDITELVPEELLVDDLPSADDDERRVFFTALTRARKRAVLLSMTKQDSGGNRKPSVYWMDLIGEEAENAGVALQVRTENEVYADIRDRYSDGEEDDLSAWLQYADTSLCMDIQQEEGASGGVRQRELFQTRHTVYGILHALHRSDLTENELVELQGRLTDTALRLPVLAAETPQQLKRVLELMPSDRREELRRYSQDIIVREPWYRILPTPTGPLTLSYSQIEQYIRCPRCYWLRNIVGLRDQGTVGASFGQIIHRTLESFYKRLQQSELYPDQITTPNLDDLLEYGRLMYQEMRGPEEAWSRKIEREIEGTLRLYYDRLHSDQVNPVHVEHSVVFDYPLDGMTHKIKARMDRVDYDGEGYHVIDYKTGQPSKKRLEPKSTDLQLGVYLLALRAFLEDDEPTGSAQYWLTRTGEKGIIDFSKIKLKGVCKKIDKAINGILAGEWERNKRCTYCELLADGWSEEYEDHEADISP